MTTPLDSLIKALQAQAGFEVLEFENKLRQLRIVGRVKEPRMAQWKEAMRSLLSAQADAVWKVDISKNYFLRQDKVFYGWRLIFQPDKADQAFEDWHIDQLLAVVKSVQKVSSYVEIKEAPLLGAHPNRNSRTNVGNIGQVALGPAAVRGK